MEVTCSLLLPADTGLQFITVCLSVFFCLLPLCIGFFHFSTDMTVLCSAFPTPNPLQ